MNKIQSAVQVTEQTPLSTAVHQTSKQSVSVMLSNILDSNAYKKRFDELLGARAPQFVASIVSLINGDNTLQQAFFDSPVSIIQSALKAATYDLPIDPALGYAYVVPFKNNKNGGKYEAQFIMGYKGMNQLALRSGAYKTINILDVREGELLSYNRLTEEIEFDFIADDDERETKEVIGYVGYFKLINGTEKTLYMSKKQIDAHEKKNRKGQYMGKGWRDDYDAMCRKTVYRQLIGKWGLMSIDYQKADKGALEFATSLAKGTVDDSDIINIQEEPIPEGTVNE